MKLILHIPHSSTVIPFKDGFVVDDTFLEQEILKLTDWHTEDLFHSPVDEMITAGFSRIFCDPERFEDDAQEVMARYGMGVLYEKSDAGEQMRVVDPELRERILNGYYRPHHKRLSNAVNEQLARFGKALIIDCHSYPATPFRRDLDQTLGRPDFNIGTDPCHTPRELVEWAERFFQQAGYTLGVDKPYSGSIVPMEHYGKDKRVSSIMLEVNRALYLNGSTNERSARYAQIKEVVREFLERMRHYGQSAA